MRRLTPSFGEFTSLFPKNCSYRALEFLFTNSRKVRNFNDYLSYKNSEIDFEFKEKKILISKISNEDYPIARITKSTFFRGNKLVVYSGVFIPRPETENLVEITVEWVKTLNLSNFSYLDLCTGAGNILISILGEFKENICKYTAVDFSFLSCKNAIENIHLQKLTRKGYVYCSDWFNFLRSVPNWDVITINPPYVSATELKPANLYKYDPKWALQAGLNGWSHYQRMIEFAVKNLFWKLIILECSEFHECIWDNLDLSGKDIQISKYKDYLGKFRVVVLSRV